MRLSLAQGVLVVSALVFTNLFIAHAQTAERSLEEFLGAQGTFCYPDGAGGCTEWLTPLPNILGVGDGNTHRCTVADYAGLADQWLRAHSAGAISLGTTVTGTIKEYARPDGRAEIIVRLVTSNALIYSVSGCDMSPETVVSGPLEFGRRVQEVLAGATPSLADVTLIAKYLIPAPGLPLKDLVETLYFPIPDEAVAQVLIDADAHGELRAAFGVPDGTPGRIAILQQLNFDVTRPPLQPSGMPLELEQIVLLPLVK
jgi:hypothetical protein